MGAMTEQRLIHIESNVDLILNEMRRHATLLEEELHSLRKCADVGDDMRRRLANLELEAVAQRTATIMLREDFDRYVAGRHADEDESVLGIESTSEDG